MEDTDELSSPASKSMKMTVFGLRKKFPTVHNIKTATLFKWMQGSKEKSTLETDKAKDRSPEPQVVVLDARPVEEYEVSHIPGAIRVDHSKNAEEIISNIPELNSQVPPRIVCYCSVGYRSSVVAENLSKFYKKQELNNPVEVFNLEGSIFQWANEGRSMIDGHNQQTKFAHPYNSFFGMLLNGDLRKSKLELK